MPPPSAPPPGSLLGTIVQWLTGISTWNRAAIAIVLGSAVFAGYLILTYPQQTFDLLVVVLHEPEQGPAHHHGTMTYFGTDVQRELDRLLAALGPEIMGVTAWRIDLPTNSMLLVRFAVRPEYAAAVEELARTRWRYPVTLFRDTPKVNDALGRIYTGRFICIDPADAWTEALARFPIAEVCLVAIPPEGIGLDGMVAGAWRSPIPVAERDRVELAFRTSAQALVSH